MQVSSEVINLHIAYILHIVYKFYLKLPIFTYCVQIAPERQLIKIVINLFVEILIEIGWPFCPPNKVSGERKRSKLCNSAAQ